MQPEQNTSVSTKADPPVVGMEMARGEDSYQITWPDLLCQSLVDKSWWRSWLRHCATIWKMAGLIPDGVTENFL
jgi:hypothetical protein